MVTRASAVQAVLRVNGGVVEKTIACGPVGIGVVTGRMAQSIADGCSVHHCIGKGSLRRSIGRPPGSGVDRAGHITHVKSGLPRNRGGIARLWRNRKRIGDHFGRSIVQRAPAGMGLLQKAQVTTVWTWATGSNPKSRAGEMVYPARSSACRRCRARSGCSRFCAGGPGSERSRAGASDAVHPQRPASLNVLLPPSAPTRCLPPRSSGRCPPACEPDN